MKNKKIKKIIGMDIGAGSVKIVTGDVQNGQILVRKMVTHHLPEQVFSDGDVKNPEAMTGAIRDMLRANKITERKCHLCVDSTQLITREVLVPASAGGNLSDVAKFEMAQFLPVELKNYVVQSKRIRELEVDGKPFVEASVTAFPKEMVDKLHDLVLNAGLQPLVLDTHANAVSKLFEMQEIINGSSFKRKTVAFIELGYESTMLTIFQNGQFKFNRTIARGGRDMDANIAKFLDIPLEEAMVKKMNAGDLNESLEDFSEESRILNIMRSSLDSILDELEKFFRYHATRSKGMDAVEVMYLYGGLSNLKGICGYFEGRFKTTAEKIEKVGMVDWPGNGQNHTMADYFNAIGAMARR
ncbi:pilus assembly protein PilM [Anaerotalea alkaliphila]|uniref:Pilus assembly protein PilM n=1 Tax=Anaerotalea alkaliphila TaxID=2662126 RepID=A0A7X5HT81_9FIRM|nr:pilus assembly protein PilM [Anaerotalea alkaliphila]NDL66245.1 pilus assembly protein PilM [Anaerotalea alkaliphila]